MERILIIDDTPSQLALLSRILTAQGFDVTTATNGLAGFLQICTERPEAVVSDVMMPELNGYQLCRLIRNDPDLADLPIILLTSLEERKARFWAEQSGADSYVTKGGDIVRVGAELRRVLGDHHQTPGKPARSAPPAVPPGPTEVHARVHKLLDQLLFEATVNGRLRELARHAVDLDAFGHEALGAIAELIDFDLAAIWLAKPDRHALVVAPSEAARGALGAQLAEALVAAGCNAGLPAHGTSQDSADLPASNEHPLVDPEDGTGTWLVTPLESSGNRFGAVILLRDGPHPAEFNRESREIMSTVARELAITARYALSLAEIEQVKADFAAMVVHDLRSPLAAIIGALELFQLGDLGKLSDDQQVWIERSIDRAQSLMGLVSDYLDLSKIEAGHIEIECKWIDCRQLLAEAVKSMSLLAEKKGLKLVASLAPDLPLIFADPRRIEQVVTNLTSNAIKFTERGSVQVIAELDAERREVRISIKDSGIGIPLEEQAQVFEKYRQARSGRGKGTGLGLVICRMLTEAHGGRIELKSEVGLGSTFTAVLPVGDAEAEGASPSPGELGSSSQSPQRYLPDGLSTRFEA